MKWKHRKTLIDESWEIKTYDVMYKIFFSHMKKHVAETYRNTLNESLLSVLTQDIKWLVTIFKISCSIKRDTCKENIINI